jgi:hypothetical protein
MATGDVTSVLQLLFVRELRGFARELELCPDDAVLWMAPPGVTNALGNLAAHVCGNLQHYVGHVLGGTDYKRNRDLEFSRRSGTRAELLREIDTTIAVVESVMPALTDEMVARPFPEQVGPFTVNTNVFLHHLSAHIAFHLGQAGYLRRIATGDARSADPVPVKAIATA